MRPSIFEYNGKQYDAYFGVSYETYRLGDQFDWRPSFHEPGEWDCGSHLLEGRDDNTDKIRVIVRPTADLGKGQTWQLKIDAVDNLLDEQLSIVVPPDLWPEQAWEAKRWHQRQRDEKEFQEHMAWQLAHPGQKFGAGDAVNSFTRKMMQGPGFTRLLFGPWEDRPELTEKIRELVLKEFFPADSWLHGEHMLRNTICYRGEHILTELDLWDEGPYKDKTLTIRVKLSDTLVLEELEVRQLAEMSKKPGWFKTGA